MSIEISLPLKLFGALRIANHGNARVRILSLRVVGLHMGFPIITPFEELATNLAFMGRFFWGRPLAFLLDTGHTWKNRLHVEPL